LGNAFYDGALLAVERMNSLGSQQFQLKVEDTEGDPVIAAVGARRLAGESGAIAILGSLLSSSTVSAAVVCDIYGVPLISPTATNERIWELGPDIFQTNLTGRYEASLLAQLATQVLLKKRFAVLYPDTREGASQFQIFAEEVRSFGGEVVGGASFASEATDFRLPILEVKKNRPEVVFIPASVDQMILLGPQLDFYGLGALVMGLSNWNSPKLRREVGSIMERAIFPSDAATLPAEWTEQFESDWRPQHLPPDATPVALKAYQATMLVLDTLAREGVERRGDLATALRQRLEVGRVQVENLEVFSRGLRMFSNGRTVPFPVELFAATWPGPAHLTATASTDSLTVPAGYGDLPK
jgi:branched-chain amino acid transport system substrate-binding protein